MAGSYASNQTRNGMEMPSVGSPQDKYNDTGLCVFADKTTMGLVPKAISDRTLRYARRIGDAL